MQTSELARTHAVPGADFPHRHEFPKTTRTTQGVAVMTLQPKYQLETVKALEDTPITNQSRWAARSLLRRGALSWE